MGEMLASNPDDSFLPREIYVQRAEELRRAADEFVTRRGTYAAGLVILGVIGCVLLYQAFVAKKVPAWTPFVLIPIGAYFAREIKRCRGNALKLFRLAEYYDTGVARLDHNWEALDEGREFADSDHFYASDLDLFGRGSLFQLLCSARTQAGREMLANWMKKPSSKEEVLARHAALAELRDRRHLRETLATAGGVGVSPDALEKPICRLETVREWIASSAAPFPLWGPLIALALALAAVVFPILYGFGVIGVHVLLLRMEWVFLLEILIGATFYRRVRSIDSSVRPLAPELPIFSEIARIAESEKFSSAKLLMIQSRMKDARRPIAKLRRLVGLLKERDNPYTAYVSYPLMAGTQLTMAIDRWHRRYGKQMLEWLTALGEFDALISLCAYAFEHPLDTFPELLAEGPAIYAEGLGHPLIRDGSCVRNDVQLGGDVQFLIVSGSNMSGKSTFIRAVGLNTVLAWMGAPVRCVKLRLSALTIGASVRIQDSVVDGRSHFMAEMQRLRRMIDVANNSPLLYLADEIMSGTNSQDRRIATEWVVRALVLRSAIGIITTHDLALTEIASNGLPGRNAHFEDTGEAGNLTFDYKLRPGLLTHSNALNIAHMLGIDAAATAFGTGESG